MDTDRLIAEEFSRNIGLLSESEQHKMLEARVAVAGAGGVGGLHILTLARLGIGKFNIADNDIFEPVNVSRQFGATAHTMGKNKAGVLGQMVKEINSQADARIFHEGITSGNIPAFLDGVDILIDGLDFFEIDIRRLLFRAAKERGIFALTSAPLGFGATLEVFSPKGMSFDEYFAMSDDMTYLEKVAAFAAGLAPHPYHIRYLDMSRVSLTKRTGPAVSPACTLAASLIATEVVKIITGRGGVNPVPHYLQIDLLRRKFKRGYIIMGGRNPLQRIKKWMILKKARSTNIAEDGK
jgi:molybdopterin/thiamine biosynthesis adenylyltransferase